MILYRIDNGRDIRTLNRIRSVKLNVGGLSYRRYARGLRKGYQNCCMIGWTERTEELTRNG